MATKSQSAKNEQQAAIEQLREVLKPGDEVQMILRHVSRSGMQREISLRKEGFGSLDYLASRAVGERVGKHGGIVVGGCGMDMGAALVMDLAARLYPQGFGCIGRDDSTNKWCPSSDHSNGDRDYTPHMSDTERTNDAGEMCDCHRTHWHNSGDYALLYRWI